MAGRAPDGMPDATAPIRGAMAAAVLARLAIAGVAWRLHGAAAFLSPDSNSYLTPAASIVTQLSVNDMFGRPEIFRTPGYPLLLAPGVLAGHPIAVVLVVQLFLAAAIVAITYRLAFRTLNDVSAATVCAWIVALEPTMMLWSVKVMPETLFTLCVVVCAAATLRAIDTRRTRWTTAAAAALCAAAYVKPIAYPLVLLVPVAVVVGGLVYGWSAHKGLTHTRKREGLTHTIRHAIVFAVVSAALLAPWHVRNARVAGYSGFSTITDYALYLSIGGSVMAQHEGASFVEVRARLLANTPRDSPQADPATYAVMREEGLRQLESDPLRYAMIHVRGIARTLLDPGAVEYLRMFALYPEHGGTLARTIDRGLGDGLRDLARRSPLAFWSSAVTGILLLPLVLAPVLGAWRVRGRPTSAFLVCLALAGYFIAAGGGVPGSSRFRTPAVPFLVLTSGFALPVRKTRAAIVTGASAG